jgi:uncharacterized protein (TIGR03086 family)
MAEFDVRVRMIPPDHWTASTPCEEWDVFDLVEHVTVENLWVPAVLSGGGIEDLDEVFDEGVLGSDPVDVWEESRLAALAAFDEADLDDEVTLPSGDTTALGYLQQRVAELTVHAWDLATGIAVDDELDPEVVDAVLRWAQGRRRVFERHPEHFDPAVESSSGDPPATRLLHLFGREVD